MPDQAASGGRPQPGTARVRLGAELRRIREAAGKSQRDLHGPKGSGHASNVENGRTQPSWDFIEKYLSLGGDPRHLRSLYELSRTESEQHKTEQRRASLPHSFHPRPAPQQLADLGYDDIRRHYVIEAREERYSFDATGVCRRVECVSDIRATSPGVLLYCSFHSYDADPQPGVLRVEAGQGCELERVDSHPTGSIHAYFRLDRTLDPEDAHAYRSSYLILVDSSVRARPILRGYAGHGTTLFVLDARFTSPSLPERLWWFAAENELSARIPGDGYELPLRADGHYRRPFEVLVPGWCYGFAWQW